MRLIIVSLWLDVSGRPLTCFNKVFVIRFQAETKETVLLIFVCVLRNKQVIVNANDVSVLFLSAKRSFYFCVPRDRTYE